MPPRRPTAAGLAAALGIKSETPPAPAPAPEPVAEPVAPAEPEPAAAAPAPVVAVARRPGRVVVPVPAASPPPEPVAEAAAPAVLAARREPPTTPRPVLLRRADGERHPIPPEWRDERGSTYAGWYLTDAEMRVLVDAAPPGRTCRETWPGCESQLCPIVLIGMDHTPYQDWVLGSRVKIQNTTYRKRPRA